MEHHDVANIFPMMNDDEFAALVADIHANGLQEPIWTYDGKIIDGRNRYRACQELGIEPPFREWDGGGSLVRFVVSLNLKRRHLTGSQKAVVALEIEKRLAAEAAAKEAERKRRQNDRTFVILQKSPPIHAAKDAAAHVGVSQKYVSDAKKIATTAPDLVEHVRAGLLTIPDAKTLAQRSEPERSKAVALLSTGEVKTVKDARRALLRDARTTVPSDLPAATDRYDVRHLDIAAVPTTFDADSVDIIITDPPYPREYLSVYEHLAKAAAHVLKPGGSMLVMVGQAYLTDILSLMAPHITYHWTMAYVMLGSNGTQHRWRVLNAWKPVLWFVKGEYGGPYIYDMARSAAPDKDHHDWGQSESGMADLIERFSLPGDVVLDPFCGAGTTGAVALRMNRRFIGLDIDEAALATTKVRLLGDHIPRL